MIYYDNKPVKTEIVDVFGGGNVFKTIQPYLKNENIQIGDIYDDAGTFGSPWKNSAKQRDANRPILFSVGYENNSSQPMKKRYERFLELKNEGITFSTFISDNAFVGPDCFIENGSIIMPGVFLHCRVKIAEAVYVNIRSTVSHDNHVAENVFFGPNVTLAGDVKTESGVFIGVGATVINSCTLGSNSIIAGGAMVTSSVPSGVMVAGVPAQIKKYLV